jgi:hypothetical protein
MCWNSEVSMNTFIFSMFVLILIIYNNNYTKYKIKEVGFYDYIFFFSFIIMQLNEFFVWKTIDNPFYNQLFAITGCIILFLQPIASIFIIKNIELRNKLLYAYLLVALPYVMYNFAKNKMYTKVSPLKHLNWDYFYISPLLFSGWLIFSVWFFFLLIGGFYEKKWLFLFFAISTILISYNYFKDGSHKSMWCWSLNSIMIYYAAYLLLYLPFKERTQM